MTRVPKSSDTQRLMASSSGIVAFSEPLLEFVHNALETLVDESRAKCAVVVDRTGVILASAGDFHPLNASTLGATGAATIAALNAMVARATSPEVSVRFYGADIDKIHFMLLEERLVLCLLHSRHATSGQIRSAARAFVNAVVPRIEQDRRSRSETAVDLMQSLDFIEGKLDQLFTEPKG